MSADTTTNPTAPAGSTIPPRLIPVTDIYAEPETAPVSSADARQERTEDDLVLQAHEAIDNLCTLAGPALGREAIDLRHIVGALAARAGIKPGDARFPDMDVGINLGPTVAARVQIASTDGKGWTLAEFRRLVAFLELQRSFLADEPLNVTVHFGTPK